MTVPEPVPEMEQLSERKLDMTFEVTGKDDVQPRYNTYSLVPVRVTLSFYETKGWWAEFDGRRRLKSGGIGEMEQTVRYYESHQGYEPAPQWLLDMIKRYQPVWEPVPMWMPPQVLEAVSLDEDPEECRDGSGESWPEHDFGDFECRRCGAEVLE